ncbi:altered inheritance of mitochondria protein [Rhynchospora pubera]|uniref:Altered inheritance of mitochondria protein n=1 Tax=Rhynchospora pubera TaxID=906938 RepID=A0AAV8EWV5_9POAL|nr:altered inheritance of mitochondria protein [Rhynchospora pubera]KAJ4783819.1 altered inheritance of mitochondria protein [Rhynchospora pubera]
MEQPSEGAGETITESSGTGADRPVHKGKSCKGTLYYSSLRKSRDKNPLCWGFSKSLPQVNSKLVRETETEARIAGNQLTDFKYICVGYSMYFNNKNKTQEQSENQVDLPFCVGIEILADKRPNPSYAAAHANTKANEPQSQPQPQPQPIRKRFNSPMEFLERFQKCSGLVASGVANNMVKVGSYVKESIDDILYPYRKRPK